ncbi:MAG: hypothetical protein R3E89_07140 [Thiolinea sp.]
MPTWGVKPVIWPCCWWWPRYTGLAALAGFAGAAGDALIGGPLFSGRAAVFLKQAALSAVLSVLLACRWPAPCITGRNCGRMLFLSLCLLCFVLPTLILITGLVALLGRSGWLTPWLGESWNLYGLHGILLAHVYLNLPLAVRALYQQLLAIPKHQLAAGGTAETGCLAALAAGGMAGLARTVVGAGRFCVRAVLTVLPWYWPLGGGPQATT